MWRTFDAEETQNSKKNFLIKRIQVNSCLSWSDDYTRTHNPSKFLSAYSILPSNYFFSGYYWLLSDMQYLTTTDELEQIQSETFNSGEGV